MLKKLPGLITSSETVSHIGKIENIVGMAMEASGGAGSIGDIVMIYNEDLKKQVPAEVVGFHEDMLQLMAYDDMSGIGAGSFVRNTRKRLKIPVGEALRGRVIDSMGQPMDDKGPIESSRYYYVESPKINPLSRPRIDEKLDFGIKAIDGLNTIGKGQRIGIFAGSGVGKSTLLGMIAKNVKTDINVIALVGERGRNAAYRTGGCNLRPAGHAAYEMPAGGDNHCGIFQGPGEGCASHDGFPNQIRNGTA